MALKPLRWALASLALLLLVGTLTGCKSRLASLFAPNSRLLDHPIVTDLEAGQRQADATSAFDHADYAALLAEHVREEEGLVDYAGLQEDRAALDRYLQSIAEAELTALGRDEQLALLINAYNAFTLKLILEHYPGVRSIRDLPDPWGTRRYEIGGHTLSLDDIEHGLIRPLYRDPRIHFAVNCASLGCPVLADEPYQGAVLDDQLDAAARRSLGDDRFARIEGGTLKLTSVMNWYRSDFTDPDFEPRAASLPLWASRYGDTRIRAFVQARGEHAPTGFLPYDWSLNDVVD